MGRRLEQFLLDTHVWLWLVGGDNRLPRGLRTLIDRSGERCWLSPISIWELGMLVEHGRLILDAPIRHWVDTALDRFPLREAPMTMEVSLRVHELDFVHRDPMDRIIAASALVHELTLLTVDPLLSELEWLPTRSR